MNTTPQKWVAYVILLFSFYAATFAGTALANTDVEDVQHTLNQYIKGTSYNDPELIKSAFYSEANLLLESKKSPVWPVNAKEYASWFAKKTKGAFSGRIGEILNIDVSNDIATAKVEILQPSKNRRFVDLFLLKKLAGKWKIISKTAVADESVQNGKRILFIVSNAHFHGDSNLPVGASFSELVNAYHEFKIAGFTVDFVSPEGGAIPLSYIDTSNKLQKQYLYQSDFMFALANTKRPDQIIAKNYKAVHYIGGSSAMYGVARNKQIQAISMEIYEKHNGIISSVCHGTAGIAFLKQEDGTYLVANKRISGYPDEYENPNKAYFKQFPFLITETIEKHGGEFLYSPRNKSHLEVDGRVITGQNYLSSAIVAKAIIEQINSSDF